ncbi:hypothetical protein HYH03_010205 [Edaphochlamys debaryana]|uniref:Protein kinase domain-containing protein n=1 Tax=Edaphochlamys debaryana TaxID=47281 RepID=A0A835XWD6_9CHLO|nr:hypothetical protein HYH03_010205 [Edaphochlamys debaryana]|eukprot:KAG2491416.1 hypothetical protein HYH03_010205 [Edaphochlamys debaryana]
MAPAGLLPLAILQLAEDNPQASQALVRLVTAFRPRPDPLDLGDASRRTGEWTVWKLWTWDEFRMCQAAARDAAALASDYLQPGADRRGMWVVAGRPCSWGLGYVCMAEADVEADGYTSSSAWYRRYAQPGAAEAPQPSPYQQGPDGSGLALVRSGLVLGDPVPGRGITPPAGDWAAVPSVAFDDSADFWSRGPVVSLISRMATGQAKALLSIREASYGDAWPLWRKSSTAGLWEAVGFRAGPRLDLGPPFRIDHVDPSLHDYIVAVEGCFREDGLERLVALTRTGRRYQLGLAGCTYAFREDAPPGGYLAGIAGRYTDWYGLDDWRSLPGYSIRDRPWINRLQFVWAAPREAGQPTYKLAAAASPVSAAERSGSETGTEAGSGASCIAAVPIAAPVFRPGTAFPSPCGPRFNASCPSQLCCGSSFGGPDGRTKNMFPACDTSVDACQKTCHAGYGMCSGDAEPVPEANQAVFVASDPRRQHWPPDAYERIGGAAGSTAEGGGEDGSGGGTGGDGGDTWVYLVRRDALATYEAAREYCRSSTVMGLSWSLVSVADLMLWRTTHKMRTAGYLAITSMQGGFWLDAQRPGDSGGDGNSGCLQGLFEHAPEYQGDLAFAALFGSDCGVEAAVVCRAPGDQNRGTALVKSRDGNGTAALWTPGLHKLSLSPVFGGGTTATWLWHRDDLNASTTGSPTVPTNTTAGASSAADVAGSGSTSGWQALELAEGEVVTAVHGCAGGYVESLAFETSAGRRWTTAFTSSSLCSVPFAEAASPGGYLVGLQGESGTFIHSLQLVWCQTVPAASLSSSSPPPPPPPAPSPSDPQTTQPPSTGAAPLAQPSLAEQAPSPALDTSTGGSPSASASSSSSSSSGGTSLAAVVGGAVGATLGAILLATLALIIRRRRLQREHEARKPAGAAAAAAAGKAVGGGGKGFKSTSVSSSGRSHGHPSAGSSALDTGCVDLELGSLTVDTPDHAMRLADASAAAGKGKGVLASAAVGALSEQGRRFDEYLAAYLEGLQCGRRQRATATSEGGQEAAGPVASSSEGLLSLGTQQPTPPSSAGGGGPEAAHLVRAQAELSSHQENLRIEGLLGQGGFGVVYLGTWCGLRVAVKSIVVHDALIGREGRQRHRAILEAAITKSLEHPNVVMTYAYSLVPLSVLGSQAPSPQAQHSSSSGPEPRSSAASSSDADVYKLLIIQEFCDVGSIGAALSAGVLGGAAAGGAAALCAASLARDLACGMAYIHARNIVHGDLSLGNVLLSTSPRAGPTAVTAGGVTESLEAPSCGQLHPHEQAPSMARWRAPIVAKVADFGLSLRMTGSQTHASNCFQGTPSHSAPEVLLQGRLSKAADVWSFGVILLELCHGETIQGIRARAKTAAAPAGQQAAPDSRASAVVHSKAGQPQSDSSKPPWAVLPPGIHPAIAQLIGACLSLDPSARPTFSEAAHALEEALREMMDANCGMVLQLASPQQPHPA